MSNIQWNLASPDHSSAFQTAFSQGYAIAERAKTARDERDYRAALATLHDNPDDEAASRIVFERNPELSMRMQAQRADREFNSALGQYMSASYGSDGQQPTNALASFAANNSVAGAAPNALAGALTPAAPATGGFAPLAPGSVQMPRGTVAQPSRAVPSNIPSGSPLSQPAPVDASSIAPAPQAVPMQAAPQATDAEQPQMDLSVLGQPQNGRDRAFLAMLQRDPIRAMQIDSTMRETFIERVRQEREFYTLAVEELSRTQDEAGWQAALQRIGPSAQAIGEDLSQIPRNYPGPDAVRSMLENALPVKERLDYLLDQSNVRADNERADRSTDSMIDTRDRRASEYERANRAREGNQRRGQDLTDSRVRSRSSGSGSTRSRTSGATVRAGEPTATGANGERLVVRGGRWVPAN